ncbi:MAG: alpha/beta fold hydrolase [Acidimicrobiales bacterium]
MDELIGARRGAAARLEQARWAPPGQPQGSPIALLHEGLGSVSAWGGFPARLAEAAGREVLAYSRAGYGRADPPPGPFTPSFLHEEAEVLAELLGELEIDSPLLVGHSDGGSIALIHAALGRAPQPCGVVTIAAHVLVEPETLRGIRAVVAAYPELRERLARHHADVDAMFSRWTSAWLDPAFASWSIEALLPAITCPLLVIQGEDDDFGTLDQVRRITAGAAGPALAFTLSGCGHAPHRERPAEVLAAISEFAAASAG